MTDLPLSIRQSLLCHPPTPCIVCYFQYSKYPKLANRNRIVRLIPLYRMLASDILMIVGSGAKATRHGGHLMADFTADLGSFASTEIVVSAVTVKGEARGLSIRGLSFVAEAYAGLPARLRAEHPY